jgi:hypothetical protein
VSAPVLQTRVGMALWDEHWLFGRPLFAEVADGGLGRLIALVTSGRALRADDVTLFEQIAGCVCVADPHIWPLKIARVGAAYGRFIPGLVQGLLLFESERVGPMTTRAAAEWLTALSHEAGEDLSAAALDRAARTVLGASRAVAGFGVPFRDEDERLVALTQRVVASGHGERRFYALFLGAARWMRENRGIAPNVSALAAALLLDMGFAPSDCALVLLLFCHLAQIPNARESAEQSSDVLRELPIDSVRDELRAPRISSRALGAGGSGGRAPPREP